MKLQAKLNSLTSENVLGELGDMLDCAHVSISWGVERVVSIDGYEGSVEINEFASKYLKAMNSQTSAQISLRQRLCYAKLWVRIENLYEQSQTALAQSCVYRYLMLFKEYDFSQSGCPGFRGPLPAIMGETLFEAKRRLFEFTPAEASVLWPTARPRVIASRLENGVSSGDLWVVDEAMIDDALRRLVPALTQAMASRTHG